MDHRQVRRIVRRQEEGTAERFGGRVNPGSGSNWARRHDVRTSEWLIENKTTVKPNKKSITLQASALQSVEQVALREGRKPLLQFELAGRRYVVLTEEDHLEREERLYGAAADPDREHPG